MTRAFSFSEPVLRELPEELSDFSRASRSRLERLSATAAFSREACFSRLLRPEARWHASVESRDWPGCGTGPSASSDREDRLCKG